MEMNSYTNDGFQDGLSSMEQYGGNHAVHGVSIHAKQPIPGPQTEETVEHKSRGADNLDDRNWVDFHQRENISNYLQVQNTQHPKQNFNLITVPESSSCKCSAPIVRPFKCGLCHRVYSTICQLYEHLEYVHWENEMYLFDKVSQTALEVPLHKGSSVATQTDAETVQCEDSMVDRTEDEFVDAELDVKYSTEFVKNAHSDWDGEVPRKDTPSNDNRFSAGDSECLNANGESYVTVKTEVLSAEDDSEIFNAHEDVYVPVKTEVLSAEDDSAILNADDSSAFKISESFSDSEVLNADEDVQNETNVISIKDKHTSQDETYNRLDSKEIKENNHNPVQRNNDKTKEQNKDIFCKICNKQYSVRICYVRHLSLHSDVMKFKCQFCGERFFTDSLMYSHHAKCPENPNRLVNRPPYVCSYEHCDKKYQKESTLRAHMATHNGEFPFICNECGKGFTFSGSLRTHKLVKHTEGRAWKCDQCTWAFPTRQGLSKHLKTHTQRQMLPCNTCGKEFSNKWNLEAHVRQHTGEKPFVCEICGAAFIHNVSRKAHMKVHASGV